MPIRRIAQIVHLKPTAIDAYKACHAAVWPSVLQQIQECNIRDCTQDDTRVKAISTC